MIQISSNLNYNIILIYIYIILCYEKYIAVFNMFNFIFFYYFI